ncbi:AraC family transcriptional regulator [Bradyrhizobium sp.]|uniref:AraC family transcriptional regulator n=1 Tax=Bradyrhizobium sp. TaxID=376 RepID=UPI000ABA2C46|nr:AraC family transcriptional regulator [Bradyrhizobium sp.]
MASDAAVAGIDNAAGIARLAAYSRVHTTDVDEAADSIGRIFCPHALDPLRHSWPDFHALHNCAAYSGISVNYVAYGGSVSIDPGCLDRFFLLQVPIRGRAQIRTGGREIATAPDGVASLLSPTLPTRMIWQDHCAQLILLVDRQQVESRAAALAERPAGPVEFEPHIDLNTPFGRALRFQIEYLVDLAERAGPASDLSPVTVVTLREAIVGLLLTGQRHNLSGAINRSTPHREALPAVLKRARDSLEAHAAEPLDLERLAQISGIGVRSLQLGFKRHFGVSISGVLLDIRLKHLKARLLNAGAGERITDIAFDLGFTHLSRMASFYRAKFGESPSETLRKSR